MAKSESIPEPGAPVAPGTIDPELIKLGRGRTKIGVITGLGVVALCVYFLIRLTPDRQFGSTSSTPQPVALADVVSGKADLNGYVDFEAEPMMSHAIRAVTAIGNVGLRVTPVRGTGDRVWLAMSGDGWSAPAIKNHYAGRLRRLSELPFEDAITAYTTDHPRPLFATAASVRAGLAAGKVKLVTGDEVAIADGDRVAFDLVDPKQSTIIASYNTRFPSAAAWSTALAGAGLTAKLLPSTPVDEAYGQAHFDVALSAAEVTKKLEDGKLFATRVESTTHHYASTWGALKATSASGVFDMGTAKIPADQVDLVGLYAAHGIPADAYVLMVDEVPDDYWYVMWITAALVLIGAIFTWALIRAVRRDLLPTQT